MPINNMPINNMPINNMPINNMPINNMPINREAVQAEIDRVVHVQPEEFGLTLAVLVQQDGQILGEGYGESATANTPLISWSMAKSFTHALVGIAVNEGHLDLHSPAPVPEWSNTSDPRHDITVDHLLKMRSGLEFNEDYVDDSTSHCIEMLFGSGNGNMGKYAASFPLVHEPGTFTHYSSGTTNILCRILADIYGRGDAFEAWMRSALLDPLGISDAELTFDDAGTWVGSSFLKLAARDFARFGSLYLHEGVLFDDAALDGSPMGTRILPEGWTNHGVEPSGTTVDGETYCAQWWRWPPNDDVWRASGYECQRILVWAEHNVVAVRLGKTPVEIAPAVDQWLAELIGAA